jgi:hypothetical protein
MSFRTSISIFIKSLTRKQLYLFGLPFRLVLEGSFEGLLSDGVATIRTEKTVVTVTIPILPVLSGTLAAGPCGELAFICGEGGRPLTKESFGNAFRDACRAAGVAKSAHGVRKIGATRAAENGATVAELEAIFGWSGGWNGVAVYARRRSRAPRKERDGQARENGGRTFYSRTSWKGAGASAKK